MIMKNKLFLALVVFSGVASPFAMPNLALFMPKAEEEQLVSNFKNTMKQQSKNIKDSSFLSKKAKDVLVENSKKSLELNDSIIALSSALAQLTAILISSNAQDYKDEQTTQIKEKTDELFSSEEYKRYQDAAEDRKKLNDLDKKTTSFLIEKTIELHNLIIDFAKENVKDAEENSNPEQQEEQNSEEKETV